MPQYPVRCCCQPQKIFGYLELPAGLRDGDRLPVRRPLPDSFLNINEPLTIPATETILIKTFSQRSDDGTKIVRELAVYSEDRPLEFWERLRNFTPTKKPDRRF